MYGTMKTFPLRPIACLAAVLALVVLSLPAFATDPIFPTGSRLGLIPPTGMMQSHDFAGFEDADKKAAILIVALPAAAYEQLDKSMIPETLQKQGIAIDKREPFSAAAGKGFILSGTLASDKERYRKWVLVAAVADLTALVTVQRPERDQTYSDKAVRDSLASLAVRASVPDPERLGLLPFAVGDLAGFKIDDVVPGRALMLADKPAETGAEGSPAAAAAHFVIAVSPGGPEQAADRANFARVTFEGIGGISDVQIQDAEPLRVGNMPGYQTLAKAKDGQSGRDIMVVQWLRFGTGGYMQMIGVAPAAAWPDTFTRMRAVRDSVDQR